MDPTDEVTAVTVRSMTPAEFETWAEHTIAGYARDLAESDGRSLEDALALAREQFPQLLPDGLSTAGVWLLKVFDSDGIDVGSLWIGRHRDRDDVAFVYDIEIAEAHRGRGLGRAAMRAAEGVVAAAGIIEIGLNVFGFNERARRLYDSLGYRVVRTEMSKAL